MQYKILASDLDKTLLDNDGNVSPQNWEAIEALNKMGVQFVPTTGRAFQELPNDLKESDAIRYYITSNGASVYDKQTGESHNLTFTPELGTEILDRFYQYPVCVFFHSKNVSYTEAATHNAPYYQSFHLNPFWVSFVHEKQVPIANLKEYAYANPDFESASVFFQNEADLQAILDFFGKDKRVQTAQTDPWNIEICAAYAGKGNALRLLAQLLSVPVEQTIGVGDSSNDKTLIQTAGLGLAMSNAVPEIKAIADDTICSNQEHSIAYILKHYF